MAICTLLCAVSCPDGFYYMPFKESEEGMNAASFYLDGEPFRSESSRSCHMYKDSLGTSFTLTVRCKSDLHSGTYADLHISMQTEPGTQITKDTDYNITGPQPETETETEGTPEEAGFTRISIGNMQAKSGWIRFRSFGGKLAAGNFELAFEDDDFVGHTVLYGNFDARMQ